MGSSRAPIGHERLQALSPSRLSTVWRTMYVSGGMGGKPLSVRTVQYARSVLRRALNDAVVERVLEVNPVVGSKCPKADGKAQHTTWTGDQVRIFLEHLGDNRWAPLWHLATASGMRRGERMGRGGLTSTWTPASCRWSGPPRRCTAGG
jgi:integrase